jgi:hypothetical protein
MARLTCQMRYDCAEPVTMIDRKGYVYCTEHGIDRRFVHPCRKLLKREVKALERDEAIHWNERAERAAERRTADRIDGYDRDDLGESPDY